MEFERARDDCAFLFNLLLFLDNLTGAGPGQLSTHRLMINSKRQLRVIVIGALAEASYAILKVDSR